MHVQASKEAARLEQMGNVDGVAQGIKHMQAGQSSNPRREAQVETESAGRRRRPPAVDSTPLDYLASIGFGSLAETIVPVSDTDESSKTPPLRLSLEWWQSRHALVATQGVLADQYMQVINERSPLAVSIPVVRLR